MDYFFCYNKHISDYLFTKNVKYITVAMDVKTQRIFSLYQITPEFQKALAEFKSR